VPIGFPSRTSAPHRSMVPKLLRWLTKSTAEPSAFHTGDGHPRSLRATTASRDPSAASTWMVRDSGAVMRGVVRPAAGGSTAAT
jgi:hypothetical protein